MFSNAFGATMAAETFAPIPYVNLAAQIADEAADLSDLFMRVISRGDHVGGEDIALLEQELAAQIGVTHVVALKSGTDALVLTLKALGIGPGDEVITPPNSFIASTAAIVHAGATPVFADVGTDQNIDPEAVERAISPRTRAIMPVHLTGRMCEMDALRSLAEAHGLLIIEDAAQSVGSTFHGQASGALGKAGCFSTHPLKNLNALGDGGFVSTNDDDLASRLKRLRNHGMIDRETVAEFGFVSRMDTVQAAILRYRLARLPGLIAQRRRNATAYRQVLDPRHVYVPPERPDTCDTYHTFVIQTDGRDALKAHLAAEGIGTAIHYPVPIHLQPAAAGLGYAYGDFPVTESQSRRILTLPVNQFMTGDEVQRVADAVNRFFG